LSENKAKEQKLLFIDLNDTKTDNSISHSIAELKNSGCSQIDLEVKSSPEQETIKLRLSTELFKRIKEVQDLPDWVIIKLILAAGKLKNSGFNERFPNG
jgi:hypothetical protein